MFGRVDRGSRWWEGAREQTAVGLWRKDRTCAYANTSVNSHVCEFKSVPVNVGIHVSE